MVLMMLCTAGWLLSPVLGVADAASGPTNVTVTAATDITGDSAQLNGTLNPGGDNAEYEFEYGPTSAAGFTSTTPETQAGNGTANVQAAAALDGLQPGTTYQYALVVTDTTTNTTTTSQVLTFTTASAPDVSTPTASVNGASVTLNGSVNPEGSGVTDCEFDYGTTTSYGDSVPCNPTPGSGTSDVDVSGALSSLLPGTTYDFRLAATNGVATSDSTQQQFTTAALAPTVTASTPTLITATGATLGGTVDPNGANTTYYFQYGTSPTDLGTATSLQTLVSSTSPADVSADISGLRPGQTYYYKLVADNSAGTSVSSVIPFLASSAAPVVTASQPTSVTATSATLNGTVDPEGADTSYTFEYGTTPGDLDQDTTGGTVTGLAGATSVSADLSGLTPGSTIYWCLEASNSDEPGGVCTSVQTLVLPAAAPVVAADSPTSVTSTSVTLNGTVDPNGADTAYYFEYGPTDNYGNVTPAQVISAGNGSTAVLADLSGLQPGSTIHWRLDAISVAAPTGVFSPDQTLTLPSASPSVATGASADVTATTATLHGSVNPDGADTTYEFVYGTTDQLNQLGQSTNTADAGSGTDQESESASLTGLTPGTTYYYAIEATNSDGTNIGDIHQFTTEAEPPTVVTSGADSVTSTGATLTGSVNPNGAQTNYYFEYGTSSGDYTETTSEQSAGSGTSATDVSADISGLQPGEKYYYRLVADGDGTTIYGDEDTFTTNTAAPTVTTGDGAADTSTTATLHGSVNPDGADTKYEFVYGTTDQLDQLDQSTTLTDIGDGTAVLQESASLTGLTPGTTYYWAIEATNSDNSNGPTVGDIHQFTTPAAPPTVVTTSANPVTSTGATLNGSVDPNGGQTNYYFEYGTSSGDYTETTSEQSAGSGTSVTDVSAAISGLQPGETYYYRLVADGDGTTIYGSELTFTAGTAAPAVTTDTSDSVTSTTATLHGTVNPDGADTTYTFVYGTTEQYGQSTTLTDIGDGTAVLHESASLTGLAPGTTYHYAIEATNSQGTTTGADHTFTTLSAPATVVTSSADSVTSTGATLTGTINPNGAPTSYYFEYGLTSAYGQDTPAQSLDSGNQPDDVSAVISGLQPGATYHYRLVADNGGGDSYGSDQTFTADTAAPQVGKAHATDITATTATLRASINPEGAATDYSFDWGTTASYGQTTTTETIPTGTAAVPVSAELTGLTPGTTYHFRIGADNGTGSRSLGPDVTFTTAAGPPVADTIGSTGISSSGATLTGSVNPNGADARYYFEYGTTDNYGQRTASEDAGAGTSPVAVTAYLADLAPGTTYHYRIVSTNSAGTVNGTDMTFVTAPGAPSVTTGLASGIKSRSAVLAATVSADGDTTSYRFQYGTTRNYGHSTAAATIVAGVTDTPVELTATGLQPGTLYHYRVVATNSAGMAVGDDQVFMTPAASPSIVGDPASHVTADSATVAGTLDGEGASTRWWFDYGTSRQYGKRTAAEPARDGKKVREQTLITNLTPGTRYHFRLVVANAQGFGFGRDETLTTKRGKSRLGMRTLDAMPSRRGCKTLYKGLDDAVGSHVTAARVPALRNSQCTTGEIVVSGAVSKLADGSRVVATFSGPARRSVSTRVKNGSWKVRATLPGLFASRRWTLVVRFAGNKHLVPASVVHGFMLATRGG